MKKVSRFSWVLVAAVIAIGAGAALSVHADEKSPIGWPKDSKIPAPSPEAVAAIKKAAAVMDDPSCSMKEVRVKIGETVLSIPKINYPSLYLRNGKIGDPAADVKYPCYREGGDPIKVTFLSYIPRDFPKLKPEADGHTPSSALQIDAGYVVASKDLSLFELVKKSLSSANQKIESLPVENGFYVWKHRKTDKYLRGIGDYYISVNKNPASPNQSPVIFSCGPNGNYGCTTYARDAKTGLSVSIKIVSPKLLPSKNWTEFYALFTGYIDSLKITYTSH